VRSAPWGLLLAGLLAGTAGAQTTVASPATQETPPGAGYSSLGPGRPMALSEQGLRATVSSNALRAPRGFTPLEVSLYNPASVPRPVLLAFQSHDSGRSQVARREVEVGPRQRLVTHLYVPSTVRSGTVRLRSPETESSPVPLYFDEAEGAAVLVLGTEQGFEASTGLYKVTTSALLTARFLEPPRCGPRSRPMPPREGASSSPGRRAMWRSTCRCSPPSPPRCTAMASARCGCAARWRRAAGGWARTSSCRSPR